MIEKFTIVTHTLGFILLWMLLIYFVYTVSYSLILSIAGYFYKLPFLKRNDGYSRIAVFIPAYKEDEVIIDVAQKAIDHDYPKDKFDVIVIADSLQKTTLEQLNKIEGLSVIIVSFEKSTKVKALNKAMIKLENTYDIGVILDADNIMKDAFLNEINSYYRLGNKAIQGQRVAKNKNNSMAILDGISEAINNHIYRKGTTALGLSCSFIGSGMAIDYNLLKQTLLEMDSVGGFDRDMEVRLIGKNNKVKYLKSAIVLDEKVANTKVFANQRKRWIFSQYHYLFKEFGPGIKKLFHGDFVYFNSAVVRNIQLPRIINIGLLFIVTVLSFFFPFGGISYLVWLSLFGLIVFSNIIAIPRSFINKEFFMAVFSLPKIFIVMFLLLFKLKGANKRFIHTPHQNTNS